MKNGKIVREQDFMDNTVFMQQLGLLSDPENINVIDSVYKAFGEGDIPTVLGLLDTQVEWNEAEGNALADGNPYIGPDAVLNGVFARIGAEHEYFKLVNIQLHEMANNQVLATLRYNAKLKKNGALIDAQVAHLWKVKDRKVIGFQQYVDTKQLDDALDQ
jgi:ketosteroid isomerase-like protein